MVPSAPFETNANGFFTFQGGFSRHLPRALASGARVLQPGVTARLSSARVGGRVAKFSSVRVGVWKGAKRGEVCSPVTCEVFFGSVARSAARRRAKFSSACAGGRGRAPAGEGAKAHDLQPGEVFGVSAWAKARGGLQVHNPASWRCVPCCVSAWAKARLPESPAGPQPGVVAMSSSARVGVAEGLVACGSSALGGLGR